MHREPSVKVFVLLLFACLRFSLNMFGLFRFYVILFAFLRSSSLLFLLPFKSPPTSYHALRGAMDSAATSHGGNKTSLNQQYFYYHSPILVHIQYVCLCFTHDVFNFMFNIHVGGGG